MTTATATAAATIAIAAYLTRRCACRVRANAADGTIGIGDLDLTLDQAIDLRRTIGAGAVDVGPDGRPYAHVAGAGWVALK